MAQIVITPNGGSATTYPRLIEASVEVIYDLSSPAPVGSRGDGLSAGTRLSAGADFTAVSTGRLKRGTDPLAPTVQFTLKAPLDDTDTLSNWATAAAGAARIASVVLTLSERGRAFRREWTLLKAYVYHYQEHEFPADPLNVTSQENYAEIVIRGLASPLEAYDGKNIATLDVKQGMASSS